MKKLTLVYVLGFVLCVVAHCEPNLLPVVPTPTGNENQDFIELIIRTAMLCIGSWKTLGVLGIAGIAVQLILKAVSMPFANSWFEKLTGGWKLTVVSGLTFLVAPISLMVVEKISLPSALVHTATLNAFMVFANEIYKRISDASKKPAA